MNKEFSCLIVDEAGQATEPDFFIPISRFNIDKVIVVGDPKQLSPTVLSQEAKNHRLDLSFMKRVMEDKSMKGKVTLTLSSLTSVVVVKDTRIMYKYHV